VIDIYRFSVKISSKNLSGIQDLTGYRELQKTCELFRNQVFEKLAVSYLTNSG